MRRLLKIYGVWGDENGDDGPHPMVGEASISLATACYGTGITGDNGHDQDDVLYIAFPGSDAVPGASGANWGAANYAAFESSITTLGDRLIARVGGGSTTPPPTCSWAGHCAGELILVCGVGGCVRVGLTGVIGAACADENDCSDDLTCVNGKCA